MTVPRVFTRTLPLAAMLGLIAISACTTTPGRTNKGPTLARSSGNGGQSSGYDVEHYAIDIALDPINRRIQGECRVRLQPTVDRLHRVDLDLEGLEVYGVRDGAGNALTYVHERGVLTVELGEPTFGGDTVELAVAYGGMPKKGLWFAGERNGIPTQVFTQGEPEDSHWWFPCWDSPSERATSEVRVTMPDGWVSVAAGDRIDRVEQGGQITEHWSMGFPHPAYLVTLVAGEFELREEEWSGIPLLYLAEPGLADQLEPTFEITDEALQFLSEVTGRDYPFSKYSQACVDNFPFGGMENISATTMTDMILTDEMGRRDRDAEGLIVHEAAHQWFGDLMTCKDWSHIWLNESFATYMELLYVEQTEGRDVFRARMRDVQEQYLSADVGEARRPTVWDGYRDPIDLFFKGGQTYPGGASRLHLLRFVLGDGVFFDSIEEYVAENAGRSVVTADFERAVEDVSGRDLDWFFEQWFHRSGYPEFEVRWKWDEDRQVELTVVQTQASVSGTPRVFTTPVEIEVRDETGSRVHIVSIDSRRQTIELPAELEPIWVRFDPNGWLPKRLKSFKGGGEWMAIAATDEDVNGRRDALRQLGILAANSIDPEMRELYVAQVVDALRRDSSPAVRVEAAAALGLEKGLEARERLKTAASSDSEAAVRVAACKSLAGWGRDRELARFAHERFDDHYSWQSMVAAAGLYSSASPEDAFDWIQERLLVDSPQGMLRAGLIEHLGRIRDPRVEPELLGWAQSPSAGTLTRTAAVKQLGLIGNGSSEVSRVLSGMVEDRNFRVRGAVLEALAALKDGRSRRRLEEYYDDSVFPRERRIIEAGLRRRP